MTERSRTSRPAGPDPQAGGDLPRVALSIRQPYAELILRGLKTAEYRSRPTRKRERVLIYASTQPGDEAGFRQLGCAPGELPTGVLVGSVRIAGCDRVAGRYHWRLESPRRLAHLLRPDRRPQPVFFFPFY